MAIATAASWGKTGAASTSQTVTISGAATGDLLIAIGYSFSNTTESYNSPAFTDNGTGSVWTNRADSGYVQRNRVIMGEAVVGAIAPTTVTVSLTGGGGQDIAIVVLRVTGALAVSPYDASVANSQTSATPSTAALTTTNANDLIVIGLSHDGATTSLTKPTGFTQSADAAGNSTNSSAASEPYASAWQVVSATQAAATYQWALGASRNAVMVSGAWQAIGGGGAVVVEQLAALGVG